MRIYETSTCTLTADDINFWSTASTNDNSTVSLPIGDVYIFQRPTADSHINWKERAEELRKLKWTDYRNYCNALLKELKWRYRFIVKSQSVIRPILFRKQFSCLKTFSNLRF